jgi:hypothetical protein
MCRGVAPVELTALRIVTLYGCRMIDTPPANTPPSDEWRAVSILALAVAGAFADIGKSNDFLVSFLRVVEDQRQDAPKGDKVIAWADRFATELLIG